MAASLADLIALQQGKSWHGKNHPRSNFYVPPVPPTVPPVPHSFQSAPELPPVPPAPPADAPDLSAAFAKLDELSARCDALLARNGRWTRYITS